VSWRTRGGGLAAPTFSLVLCVAVLLWQAGESAHPRQAWLASRSGVDGRCGEGFAAQEAAFRPSKERWAACAARLLVIGFQAFACAAWP